MTRETWKGLGKGGTDRTGTREGTGSYSMFLLSLYRFYYRSIIRMFISLYRINLLLVRAVSLADRFLRL